MLWLIAFILVAAAFGAMFAADNAARTAAQQRAQQVLAQTALGVRNRLSATMRDWLTAVEAPLAFLLADPAYSRE